MPVKISKYQREVLNRMRGGEEIWSTSGIYPSVFWHNDASGKSPGHSTVHALSRLGLIENYAPKFNGGQYRITEAGRVAVFTLSRSPELPRPSNNSEAK